MSIRRTLLIAFLLFSVGAAALMTGLTYYRARAALRAEIELNLRSQAATLISQIDALIFERVEDIYGWSQLDLMEEIKVGDVDKRLSEFLSDNKTAYGGLYADIFASRAGRVVAASDPALITTRSRDGDVWRSVRMPNATVTLSRPATGRPPFVLRLGVALEDQFSGQPLGSLHADFNWREIGTLLARAVGGSGRLAMLLDHEQRVLAISSAAGGDPYPRPGSVRPPAATADDAARERVWVGRAASSGFMGLPDLGWRVWVLAPQREAFAPIDALRRTLLVLLLVIIAVAVWLAVRISARIARPIQSLTAITRLAGRESETLPALPKASGEVAELSLAFRRMFENLRQSRKDLVRVSKLAAVGEMAAMLAHEVRNPLGILRSSARMLSRRPGQDARDREMLSFMLNECDRINELVTNLLEAARPRNPQFAEHDLDDICRKLLDLMRPKAEAKGIALELLSADAPLLVICDRNQIAQVLMNLVLNAIQVLSRDGRIEIRIQSASDFVIIEINDDGPGVPPAEREKILEPFVSHREGGIGLGLAIVQDILRAHHASLLVGESRLGGASFRIHLPYRNAGAAL